MDEKITNIKEMLNDKISENNKKIANCYETIRNNKGNIEIKETEKQIINELMITNTTLNFVLEQLRG